MTHDPNALPTGRAQLQKQSDDPNKKQIDLTEKSLLLAQEELQLKHKFFELASQKQHEESERRRQEREAAQIDKLEAQKKTRLQVIYMPLVIFFLTAVVGSLLSFYLQNRSFRHNELFRARLDQIIRQRNDTVALLQDVEGAWRQARSNEYFIAQELESAKDPGAANAARKFYCSEFKKSTGVETLRKSYGRSLALIDQGSVFGAGNEVDKAFNEFNKQLKIFLECVNNDECKQCTGESDTLLEPLKNAITAYGNIENRLIAGER